MNVAGYSLIISNENGDSIDLYDDPDFGMTSSTGFGLDAEINLTSNRPMDGSTYSDSYIPERHLNFNLQYQENDQSERAKLRIHKVFQAKQKLKIQYRSPNVSAMIYGYCETCDTPENVHPMVTSISIICPDPFWIRGDGSEIVVPLNGGSCDIYYDGTAPTGFLIDLNIRSSAVWLLVNCNGKYFRTDHSITADLIDEPGVLTEYAAGTRVVINSIFGEKSVLYYAGGNPIDCFMTTEIGLLYPQLVPGNNHIKITSDGSFDGKIIYTEKSGGIF